VASGRDVAAFISGVASQKLERERRAMRESVHQDLDMDPLSSTVVEPARHPMTDPDVPASILPSSAAPRVRQDDGSGLRPSSKLRQPTMAMPAPSENRARVSSVARTRPPTAKVEPLRPRAPSTPPPPAYERLDYDDDGETALFNHGSSAMAQIRGRRSVPPQPTENDTEQNARDSHEPAYDAYRDAVSPAPAAEPAPEKFRETLQSTQLRGRSDDAATLQDPAPAPSYGVPSPMPPQVSPSGDVFPMSPPYAPMHNPQATMPPGWGPAAVSLAPPPPRSSSGVLLLLASLAFLGVASAALWYVLHAAR
jgi:hypothetical protein